MAIAENHDDRFDIAEVKRASVRFKGALQAEWQQLQQGQRAVVSEVGHSAEAMVENFSIMLQPLDQAVAALPKVDFALSYKDQTLRGNSSTGFFTPLKVSNWEH
ncbi:MAG: hypothetical protein WCT03_15705 [Candidatus Obscuribacterales bacterium]